MKKMLLTLMLIILLPTYSSFADTSKGKATEEIISLVEKYAELRDLPPEVLYQVIDVESDFNTNANSKHGKYSDQGLMQLNSQWIKGHLISNPIKNFNAFNPDHNINMGSYLLKNAYISQYNKGYRNKQLWERTLTIYNAGSGYLNKYGIRNKYVSQFNISRITKEIQTNDRKGIINTNKKSKKGNDTINTQNGFCTRCRND